MKNTSDAVARYYARHAAADDLQYNAAGFWFDRKSETFFVEVREHIVATFKTLVGVREFCDMHNTERTA